MILEGETELRLKARTKFEKYDKYSRSETNRFGIVKSEDQNMSPTKTTRQRSYNSWLGIWGIIVRPDTGYGLASMAKQLNSETVKT